VVNVEGEGASTNTGGEMQQCWAGAGAGGRPGASYWVNWRNWQMKREERAS
jgi:hypothetical protein